MYTYIIVTQVLDSGFLAQSGCPTILRLDSEVEMSQRDIVEVMKPHGYDRKIDSLDFYELSQITNITKETQ